MSSNIFKAQQQQKNNQELKSTQIQNSLQQEQIKQGEEEMESSGKLQEQQDQDQLVVALKEYLPFQEYIVNYISERQSNLIIDKICEKIAQGNLAIGENTISIDQYISQKQIQTDRKDTKIPKKIIFELFKNYHSSSYSPKSEIINDKIYSKEKHKQVVKNIALRKQKLSKCIENLIRIDQKRKEQFSKKLRQEEEQKKVEKMELRKLEIKDHLNKMKQNHENFLKQQTDTNKKYKQIKKKKRILQKIEENSQKTQILIQKQKQKQIIQSRRQRYKFELNKIIDHSKRYMQSRSRNKQSQSRKKSQWKYSPPSRSERLSLILEGQRKDHIAKLELRNKQLEEKKYRLNTFAETIDRIKPKIDINKKKQIQNRLNKSVTERQQIQRMRFKNDRKSLGNQYLAVSKELLKSRAQKAHTVEPQKRPKDSVNDIRRSSKPRRSKKLQIETKQVEKIINSPAQNIQKIEKMKIENQKITNLYQMKEKLLKHNNKKSVDENDEALNLLLLSINAKINIINLATI